MQINPMSEIFGGGLVIDYGTATLASNEQQKIVTFNQSYTQAPIVFAMPYVSKATYQSQFDMPFVVSVINNAAFAVEVDRIQNAEPCDFMWFAIGK